MKNNDNFYRFALIGKSGSGKTCILAQMALNADANDRFGSSYVPLDANKPLTPEEMESVDNYLGFETEEENEDVDDVKRKKKNRSGKNRKLEKLCERLLFHMGKEVIESAKAKLNDHDRPEATPPTYTGSLVNFTLNEEARGDFNIRTMDYAGENLKPADLEKENSYATYLKNHWADYDGFLIIVETIRNEADVQKIEEDIQKISAFFTALKQKLDESGQRKVTPVAVLLSKWDRYSTPIQFTEPGEERKKVENFLEKNVFYRSIKTTVRGVVQGQTKLQDEDLSIDNSAVVDDQNLVVFPVSAFGNSVTKDAEYGVEELPDPNSKAFGLIEPFCFLANRRDELDLAALEEELNDSESSKFSISKYRRVLKKCKSLKPRISNQADQTKATRLREIRSRARKRFNALALSYTTFALFLTLCGACGVNFWATSNYNARIKTWKHETSSQQATDDQLRTILEEIKAEKGKFHGWFGAKSTDGLESDVKEKILERSPEGRMWAAVLRQENNPDGQLHNVEEYIKTYSKGIWIVDAKKLLEKLLWDKASSPNNDLEDSLKNVNEYRRQCPDGKHIAEAKIKEERLEEEIAWKKASNQEGSLDERLAAVRAYIDTYKSRPFGVNMPGARKILCQLEDDELLEKITSLANKPEEQLEKVDEYVRKYPEGAHIGDVKKLQDKLYWANVTSESDPKKKLENVKKYINVCPEGDHKDDAKTFIADLPEEILWNEIKSLINDPTTSRDKVISALNGYIDYEPPHKYVKEAKEYLEEAYWEKASVLKDQPEEEKALNEYVTNFPKGEYLDKANERLTEIRWKNVEKRYTNLLNSEDPSIAELTNVLIEIIEGFEAKDAQVSCLRSYPKRIERILSLHSPNVDKPTIIEEIKTAQSCYDQIKQKLSATSSEDWKRSATIITDALPNLNEMLQEQIKDYDKKLYDDFRKEHSISRGNDYLKKMESYGGGAMRKVVNDYLNFLNEINQPHSVPFKVKIHWGDKVKNLKFFASIAFNGKKLFDDNGAFKGGDIQTRRNSDVDLGSYDLYVDPNKPINVDAKLYYIVYWSTSIKRGDLIGEGRADKNLSEFQKPGGCVINLGDGTELRASSEAPTPPTLPDWSESNISE